MKREKVEGMNIWFPQAIGDTLKGIIKKLDSDGQFGIQALIKPIPDGAEVLTPSHKWLQNCLRKFAVGDMIEIVYDGEEPPSIKGQSPAKKYSVFRLTE